MDDTPLRPCDFLLDIGGERVKVDDLGQNNIPTAKCHAWVAAPCPHCDTKNWFDAGFHTDFCMVDADLALGECLSCAKLFWVSQIERDQLLDDLNYPGCWEGIKERGGLEAAFKDRKCITGGEPHKTVGRAFPNDE
jgi:hypothetical protein